MGEVIKPEEAVKVLQNLAESGAVSYDAIDSELMKIRKEEEAR